MGLLWGLLWVCWPLCGSLLLQGARRGFQWAFLPGRLLDGLAPGVNAKRLVDALEIEVDSLDFDTQLGGNLASGQSLTGQDENTPFLRAEAARTGDPWPAVIGSPHSCSFHAFPLFFLSSPAVRLRSGSGQS